MSNLPLKCRQYLQSKEYCFREVEEDNCQAVIIDSYELPNSKFDVEKVSLLLFLPEGYPDASPDMFYLDPWIKVKGSSSWPNAADVRHDFNGQSWQRWSRHWNDWRPGRDGIRTWLIKVRNALEQA